MVFLEGLTKQTNTEKEDGVEIKQIIGSIIAIALTALVLHRIIPRGRLPGGRKPRTTEKPETGSKKMV